MNRLSMREFGKLVRRVMETLPAEIEASLEATVRFRPNKFPTWSNATHLCVIEIEAGTWTPRIRRYVVAEDCGRMINPMIVEGQIFGGVVQGIGGVLLEDFALVVLALIVAGAGVLVEIILGKAAVRGIGHLF